MAAEALAIPQQRLHPWSWLFVLLAQLRSFALPVLALLLFGGGKFAEWELLGALAGVLLALSSVVQYFTYRYGVIEQDLVIRAGLLNRNTRSIPLARIRSVTLHRTLLHRLFGVTEVRLESAGGSSAEAHMRVLSLAAAAELEQLVQGRAPIGGAQVDAAGKAQAADLLLELPMAELLRLGLISNRGMVVAGTAFAALWQIAPDAAGDWMQQGSRWLFGHAQSLAAGWVFTLLGAVALLLLAVVVLRVLSIALALIQFHGFRLAERDGRLSVESGLLTRVRGHAPLRKVQFWTLTETLLHRLFRRQSLEVETAVLQTGNDAARGIQHLAPIATPETTTALLQRLFPQSGYPALDWQPLHARAWRRLCLWPMLFTVALCAVLVWRTGAVGLSLLALLPWWVWRARRLAACSGWAHTAKVVAFRSGWLSRRVSIAELDKLQGVQLLHSPFDRRHGMATVAVDTAGANPLAHRIHVRFLPESTARELAAQLGRHIARNPLAW